MNYDLLYEEYRDGKEPAVNCFTKALWHWNEYGGVIVYDDAHTSIRESSRYFRDKTKPITEKAKFEDIKNYGLQYLIMRFAKFMTIDELEILKRYFEL